MISSMSLLDGTDARTRARRRKLPAAMVVHQFKPGQVANPLGAGAIPKDKRALYRETRRLALDASPHAMRRAIELIDSKDERVATINIQTVLDRAGIRPIDKPEDLDAERPKFDPSLLSPQERRQVEAALRLMVKAMRAPDEGGDGERG